MTEYVRDGDALIAIIIRCDFTSSGVTFFTPDEFSQQLAFMSHPRDKVIAPHVHNESPRNVTYTREVLFLRKGRLRVDFYTEQRAYIGSRILLAGDVVLLASGGHGFKVLDPIEMIEVKQGPYSGEGDKTRFDGVDDADVRPCAVERRTGAPIE
jgi:mannose-6-phosphate isomerase-like protein (cupin superfamily)